MDEDQKADFTSGELASVLREHGDMQPRTYAPGAMIQSDADLLLFDLVRTILRQRARIQELLSPTAPAMPDETRQRTDTERLDWLDETWATVQNGWVMPTPAAKRPELTATNLRAAIDAAMDADLNADTQRQSYAAVLETVARDLLATESELGKYRAGHVAALRALAALIEKAERLPQRYFQGHPLVGHGEWERNSAIVRNDWREGVAALLTDLQAGFTRATPPEGEGQ